MRGLPTKTVNSTSIGSTNITDWGDLCSCKEWKSTVLTYVMTDFYKTIQSRYVSSLKLQCTYQPSINRSFILIQIIADFSFKRPKSGKLVNLHIRPHTSTSVRNFGRRQRKSSGQSFLGSVFFTNWNLNKISTCDNYTLIFVTVFRVRQCVLQNGESTKWVKW